MALQRSNCINHPDRYGHAVCMACKKTLCQECATDWDGIFYCSACLANRRRAAVKGVPAAAWIVVLLATAGLFALGPRLLVWGATLLQRGLQ